MSTPVVDESLEAKRQQRRLAKVATEAAAEASQQNLLQLLQQSSAQRASTAPAVPSGHRSRLRAAIPSRVDMNQDPFPAAPYGHEKQPSDTQEEVQVVGDDNVDDMLRMVGGGGNQDGPETPRVNAMGAYPTFTTPVAFGPTPPMKSVRRISLANVEEKDLSLEQRLARRMEQQAQARTCRLVREHVCVCLTLDGRCSRMCRVGVRSQSRSPPECQRPHGSAARHVT